MTGVEHTVDATIPATPGLSQNLKKKLDPAFKRNLKIIGVCLSVILALVLWLVYAGSKTPSAAQRMPSSMEMAGMTVPNTAPMPKPYQDKLNRVQTAESNAAMAQGQSYVPTPTRYDAEPYGKAQPVQGTTPQATNYSQPQTVQATQQYQDDQSGLKLQLTRLVAAMGATPPQSLDPKLPPQALTASASAERAAAHASPASAASAPPVVHEKLVDKDDIFSAHVSNKPSSDRGGDTFAELTTGPLAGALLRGTAQLYNGEYVKTHFTSMKFNKQDYDIDAVALDEDTAEEALEGSVDHKWLTRYVMPVAFAGLQGFWQAKSQTGSFAAYPQAPSTGSTVLSNYGIATPAPSQTQALSSGIAQGLSLANQNVSKLASEPVNVSLPQNLPIGVIFNTPVFAK